LSGQSDPSSGATPLIAQLHWGLAEPKGTFAKRPLFVLRSSERRGPDHHLTSEVSASHSSELRPRYRRDDLASYVYSFRCGAPPSLSAPSRPTARRGGSKACSWSGPMCCSVWHSSASDQLEGGFLGSTLQARLDPVLRRSAWRIVQQRPAACPLLTDWRNTKPASLSPTSIREKQSYNVLITRPR
jgi:hypothetical protein